MTTEYDTARLRQILISSFSAEDLKILCFDHFRQVYLRLPDNPSAPTVAQMLLDHCFRNKDFPRLIRVINDLRPGIYIFDDDRPEEQHFEKHYQSNIQPIEIPVPEPDYNDEATNHPILVNRIPTQYRRPLITTILFILAILLIRTLFDPNNISSPNRLVGEWTTRWDFNDQRTNQLLLFTINNMTVGEFAGSVGYLYDSAPQCSVEVVYSGVLDGAYSFLSTDGPNLDIDGRNIPYCDNYASLSYKIASQNGSVVLIQMLGGREYARTTLTRR